MRIAPRWRKVLGDLEERPVRAALAVLSMAAGVFGLGAMLTSYSILRRELLATYESTRPASATLFTDDASDAVVESVRRLPGVRDAEARRVIRGRIRVGPDEWRPLVLFVVRDFRDLRIDTFRPEAGAWPPAEDEVLLERASLPVARAAIDDRVTVRAAGGGERTLRIAGTVHAAGLAPGWMDHVVSGFVDGRAAMRGDGEAGTAGVRIVVAGDRLDERHIREVADRVKASLEARGVSVTRIDVPEPGRHPHADQMETFILLLGAFGLLTFALSAVLVANLVHALLIEQVRQVGVMKTIGATTSQVIVLYLGQVSILAVASLGIGIPFGILAGRGYAQFAATILNATIASDAVATWVLVVEAAVGILVPLLVALGPVRHASRITIHDAFQGDLGRRPFGSRRFDRWLAGRRWLPRPLMLSLRTAFHRRGRLLLTVGTLAAGGTVFVSALNVSAAWSRALEDDARARRYDIDVRLSDLHPVEHLAQVVETLPDVGHAEYWPETRAGLVGAHGQSGSARVHGIADERVSLVAPDLHSKLLALPVLQGRWLGEGDHDAVVVNQALLAREPTLRIGARLDLSVDGRVVSWPLVGVVKEMAPFPVAYAPSAAVLEAMQQPAGTARSIRLVTRARDSVALLRASRDIERALERAGVGVLNVQSLADSRKAFADHLVIIESALILAAGLVVLVGALGLTSTLTLNVLERTRELGIQSAIGATPRMIAGQVVFEGVLMGVLGWCLAIVTAVPVSLALDAVTGSIFIKAPLGFVMSAPAAANWLVLVVILSALSSAYPARRAASLTVREALAHA